MFNTGNAFAGHKAFYVIPVDAARWVDMELENALYLLTQDFNWVPSGAVSSADAAEAFSEAFDGMFILPNPAGMVIPYGGQPTSIPSGALLCDGSSYLAADYPALFAVVGYTFGGVGSSFNVPDMRSNVPIGVGGTISGSASAVADTGGEQTHTLVEGELPVLAHAVGSHAHTYIESIPTPSLVQIGAGIGEVPTPSVTGLASDTIANHGAGGAHNNLQPYLVLSFIILTGE